MKYMFALIIFCGCVPIPHYLLPRTIPAAVEVQKPSPNPDVTILDQAGLYRWLIKHHKNEAERASALLETMNNGPETVQNH